MKLEQRQMLVAFVSGLLFAVGLGIAGMTDPAKVLAFLDMFGGNWDPSLMFVMGGAILVYAPVYHLLVKHRDAPKFGDRFHWPTAKDIDVKLVIGSALFGIGWGLAGLCPGPALVATVTGTVPLLVYAAAMIGGMLAHWALSKDA
jgi:uncharacterized protein